MQINHHPEAESAYTGGQLNQLSGAVMPVNRIIGGIDEGPESYGINAVILQNLEQVRFVS